MARVLKLYLEGQLAAPLKPLQPGWQLLVEGPLRLPVAQGVEARVLNEQIGDEVGATVVYRQETGVVDKLDFPALDGAGHRQGSQSRVMQAQVQVVISAGADAGRGGGGGHRGVHQGRDGKRGGFPQTQQQGQLRIGETAWHGEGQLLGLARRLMQRQQVRESQIGVVSDGCRRMFEAVLVEVAPEAREGVARV